MERRRKSRLILLATILSASLCAQERIRFVTYNVENLFDCKDDTTTNDNEFLPESPRHWTPYRYWNKLQALSQVITTIGNDRAPDFVALCEVENDSVLHDLTIRSGLRTAKYRYIVTSSSDPRGIDVALLYKPTTFYPLMVHPLRLEDAQIPKGSYTRDILYVSGLLHTGDTLDILICHFPSRRNGQQAKLLRHNVANYMRQTIDSICHGRTTARIVAMGDFNDTPYSKSLRPITESKEMVCITENLKGSYRYKGQWEQIDHIYLSQTLVDSTQALHLASQGAWIANDERLVEPEPLYGGVRPYRTYNGMRYQGGFSDHLPVCFDLWIKW